MTVRASLIGLLTKSDEANRQQSYSLGAEVVRHLITLHRAALSKPSRCYANSDAHRRSHRIMTAVLLLDEHLLVSCR